MKMNDEQIEINTTLLAGIVDRLSLLVWTKTKDAEKGRNKPKSLISEIYPNKVKDKYERYISGKDFEEARNKILKKIGDKNGN